MVPDLRQVRQNAVLLRGDELGVSTEHKRRKLQKHSQNDSFRCTLNPDWVRQLGLNGNEASQTVHSMTVGVKPVIVQNAAIIIQPASILTEIHENGHESEVFG